jgi:hypothetical protein
MVDATDAANNTIAPPTIDVMDTDASATPVAVEEPETTTCYLAVLSECVPDWAGNSTVHSIDY